jgi:hypothetical protein
MGEGGRQVALPRAVCLVFARVPRAGPPRLFLANEVSGRPVLDWARESVVTMARPDEESAGLL